MAFRSSKGIKKKYIFVLLGPSGSGKTTYGERQARGTYYERFSQYRDSNGVMFLSTGRELRKYNVMNVWQEADMTAIKDFCHKLITETFENFKTSVTHKILILDCIKDLEDAEYVAAQAKKHCLEVTKALLFDIDADNLHEHWMKRKDDRDAFRGPPQTYLRNWRMKSNDLLNYYKKSSLLCSVFKYLRSRAIFYHHELPNIRKLIKNAIPEDLVPVVACPNYVSFMLTDSIKIKSILVELYSILKVNQHHFTLPASFVHCRRDVTWVTNPSMYQVTAKTDGVRCLLLKIQDGTYLITRKNEIYPCYVADDKLPVNTVLDGELLPSPSISEIHPKISKLLETSVLLVFDVLVVSGEILWKWPFTLRLERLCNLPISQDISAVMKQASRSTDDKSTSNEKLGTVPDEKNNQNELLINCVVKEHKQSNTDEVLKLLRTLSQFPYPCDGLVFTPNTAYVFGPDPLLFKWQNQNSVHCDIQIADLKAGVRPCAVHLDSYLGFPAKRERNKTNQDSLSENDIMECEWNQSENAWDPLFVRQDKSAPNSDETIDHVEKICQQPYTVKYLIEDLTRIGCSNEHVNTPKVAAPPASKHPSGAYSFDELYAEITKLVHSGYVEKTVDSCTDLEIINCSKTVPASVSNSILSQCRGLVVHPNSKTIVTKPFVRFFEGIFAFYTAVTLRRSL